MPRPKLNKKIVRVSVSLDESMYLDIRHLAETQDVSISWMLRKAAGELIEKRKEGMLPQQLDLITTFKSDNPNQ